MQAKYSSTRDMLDDDDTTISLYSGTSTVTRRAEPRHSEWDTLFSLAPSGPDPADLVFGAARWPGSPGPCVFSVLPAV
uniref:C-type lectin domain family 1, member a n=1 Tax=Mus musculus TaxID=10090 RepID=A0A0N4SWF3_MOUSE